MRRIFKLILCSGFLIGLVAAGAAQPTTSRHAGDRLAQNADSKMQTPSPDPTWILTGKIGDKYALRMELHRKDDQISGRYRYLSRPKANYLALRGAINKSGSVELSEYVVDDSHKVGKQTGTFKGILTGNIVGQNGPAKFAGVWTNANASVSMEFSLSVEAAGKTAPADSAAHEDRVNITSKLHILREDPDNPIPKDVSLNDDDTVCCYYKEPLITGKQPKQVLEKIRSALDFKNIYDGGLDPLIEELYDKDDRGKRIPNSKEMNIDYEVVYNENYVLSFEYKRYDALYAGLHTRPFYAYDRMVFDLKTGNVLKAKDVFIPDSLPALALLLDRRLQDLMKDELAEFKKEGSDEDYNDLKDMFADQSFTDDHLDDFTVDGKGVTFNYDYGAHSFVFMRSPLMSRTDEFKLSYEELKQYINPKGILGRFISK
jgi:hypothetical protein